MSRLPLLLLALAFVATGCTTSSATAEASMPAAPSMTLVETAVATDALSTLVTAVQAADLVETLNGPGPFTVFAPTNAAFAAVPEATLSSLLMPENQAQLQGVLTFHVVAGEILAADLRDGQVVETVNGESLTVSIADGAVMIGNANGMATVAQADVMASNGVAHVIDAVLLP